MKFLWHARFRWDLDSPVFALHKGALIALALATPAHAETVTIAVFGDSLTQGFGLSQDDGFVPQLQAWLEAQDQDVVLLNAGVSGDTTAGGAARIDWTLTPEVDAMIVTLGGNDMLRGLAPEEARKNLTVILDAARNANVEVLLSGMQAPGNFGQEYKVDFDSIYPDLAATYDAILYPDFLAALTDEISRDEAVKRYMQADGIHPNKEGVAVITSSIGPYVLDLIARSED